MEQPPYFPFKDGWRMAMGLKPLPLENWIEIDADFAAQLTLKTRLLTERYADVFASLPETGIEIWPEFLLCAGAEAVMTGLLADFTTSGLVC